MLSAKATELVALLQGTVKMGDIKKQAKVIKRDHDVAMELWQTQAFYPRMLATLILDKKQLTQDVIDQLAEDMLQHEVAQRNQLSEWLMANQLMKQQSTQDMLLSWQDAKSPVLRRLFWYHQARLRWAGQTPPDNSEALLALIEEHLATEEEQVQWTMNFCAGWIGIFEPEYRDRCVRLGESLGLYKDEKVSRNCTPSYLPEFIRIEVAKREA